MTDGVMMLQSKLAEAEAEKDRIETLYDDMVAALAGEDMSGSDVASVRAVTRIVAKLENAKDDLRRAHDAMDELQAERDKFLSCWDQEVATVRRLEADNARLQAGWDEAVAELNRLRSGEGNEGGDRQDLDAGWERFWQAALGGGK